MKKLYTIQGLKNEGDMIRLVLDSNNPVQEKKGLMESLGNLSQLQQQMTVETQRKQNPDQIRIPYQTWQKHQWNIGDVITVTVEEE
ncbi:MAG: hypothetical protein KGY65_07090 [Candidatus Thermoplasmatota archaeon]|nr:hypothetical protein [Candidatus Thermoplasmatota archaeon]MBS3802495.1 hypothetical protein [Candidatus Thermoplasmatota archaeon]